MAGARIQLKRATAAAWTAANTVLFSGEIGLETDTGKFKIGNGSTAWTSLGYSIVSNLSSAVLNDLGDVTITNPADGDFLRWNGTAFVNDAVDLGTDTTGSFVEFLVAGTGVTLTDNSGESATPTVAIGQDVATSASVEFAALTVNGQTEVGGHILPDATETYDLGSASARFRDIYLSGTTIDLGGAQITSDGTAIAFSGEISVGGGANLVGDLTGNADTASTLETARTISLNGDLSGSVSFDGSADVTITATVEPDSVELGVDTTGNFMSDVVAGTGVTVTHTPGESSSASIAIGQDVATSASVTFANVTISGDLTVSGTTTTLNTEQLLVEDNIVTLNSNATGAPSANAGIEIERGDSTNVELRWNETTDSWEITKDGSTYGNIAVGQDVETSASVTFAAVTAPLIGNADTASALDTARTISLAGDLSGSVSFDGTADVTISATVQPDSVALGTDTTGNFVNDVTAGTGVTVTHTPGEGSSPTVAIGQAVGTSSSVTFANVSADLVGDVTGNADTATSLETSRTISLGGDLSGSASFDGTSDVTITATVQPDSVALGTDTTGNFMSDVVGGTGVTVSHTPGESSSASVSIGQDVATSASVTFAAVTAPVVGNVTGDLTGNADTATSLETSRTISLIGDVSGSVSFDGTSNAQITTAIQPNSIVLGTDTIGNYMESITNGTGIFLEHVLGEASQATISIGQAVGTGDTVTFAGVTADAIKIGVTSANTIDTTSGNLTIDSAGGTVTIDDNLSITGTLTVSGSVAVINTTNLQIGDNIITLNIDEDGSPSQNAGIEIERGTSTNVVLQYNETSDVWELTNDGSLFSPIETNLTVITKLNQRSALLDVWAVTDEALPGSPVYTNGTSDLNGGTGIGAKLTATTNGLLYVDNIPAGINYRVLVKDQANPVHNGIYKTTVVGSESATWELTRSSDFDNSTLGQTIVGKTVRAAADGDVNEFQVFAVTSLGSQYLGDIPEMVHVIGTDPIVWSQVSGKAVLIPGNGLEITNNTLTLPSIAQSNTASIVGSNNFIQNISVDSFGRLTGVTTNDVLLALGTNTTGDYVASISASAGTGITVSGAGEGAAVEVSSNATPDNTASTIVMRDENGHFSAGLVIGELSGNALTANTFFTNRTIGLTGDLSGSVSFDGSQDVVITAIIEPNSVALGTDTSGDYVSSLIAGTGITLANNSGETVTPTISIGQAVETSSSVTFANVSADLFGNVTGNVIGSINGNAGTATVLQTARNIAGQSFNGSADISIAPTDLTGVTATATELNHVDGVTSAIQTQLDNKASSTTSPVITLAGDLSGSAIFTNLGNATLTATIAADSVALGTDTTGNFVNDLTGGTGVTITHTPSEGSSPTVAIGQSVETSASVTFAQVETTGNVIVGGDLQVAGTLTTINETNLAIEDTFIYLNDGSTTTNPDLGWVGNYNDGTFAHAGLFRDASDGKFKFFDSLVPDPTDPIDVNHSTYADAPVMAMLFESTITTGTPPLVVSSSTLVTNLNADFLDGQSGSFYAPVDNASFTGTFSAPSGTITSSMIADGTIVNADVSASAAIDLGKLADVSTNAQVASYTLVLDDKNKIVEMNVGSANNLTVPLNSSVAWPVGAQINILQTGTGQTTIVATGGVTINATPGLKMRAQFSYATLIKRATDTWVLVGDISA